MDANAGDVLLCKNVAKSTNTIYAMSYDLEVQESASRGLTCFL